MKQKLQELTIVHNIPIAEMYMMDDNELRTLSEERMPNGYPTRNAQRALKVFKERYAPDMWRQEPFKRRNTNYASILFQETGVADYDLM